MKYNKKHIIISLLLPFQIIIVRFLSEKTAFIEQYYSSGFYPFISKILRSLFGWLPFSFGDTLLILLLIISIKNIANLIKNRFKNILQKLLYLTSIASILYGVFYLFWGFNYFRNTLANNLQLTQNKYTTKELINTTNIVLSKLNTYQFKITKNDTVKVVSPYTTETIYKKAINGYKNITKTYPQLQYETVSVKSSLISLFQSYNGTSGYINPFTNEAQINNMLPKTSMPTIICHEIAHQIGWAAENDANFIGFLTAKVNDDIYFKYAAYRMAFSYLISEVKKRDKNLATEILKTVNKGVIKDFNASFKHWEQFKNPIEPYIKKGYNSYLKANNQAGGIKSYSYVVDLLIAYYQKQHKS